MPLRFLHLADLHLDTAFGGRPETRARLRAATREAFEAAVDLALTEGLDAVLVAGDGFDEERLDFRTELWLGGQVARLARGGVSLVWIAGNHDPGRASGKLARLGLGAGETAREQGWGARVHVIRGKRVEQVDLQDAHGRLVGRVLGAGHSSDQETDNLAARFRPQDADVPLVGLLHTQVHAAAGSAEHAPYAPSTEADLAAPGYDYWALGHVHLRGQPFEGVPAWYAGNLCGRNPRETGPKGGLLVELEAGAKAAPQFIELAPVRWERVVVEGLEACHTTSALVSALERAAGHAREQAKGAELLLRLVPTGPCPLAAHLLDRARAEELEEALREQCGLLELQLRPAQLHAPRDLSELRNTPSALAQALSLAETLEAHPERFDEWAPSGLASLAELEPGDQAGRAARLAQLTEGLAEQLLQRALTEGQVEGEDA